MSDAPVRVLVVDDDETVSNLLAEMVGRVGHHATTACSADEALAKLTAEPFELLLADIVMPGRGGIELTQAVRALKPEVAVILVSAQSELRTVMEGVRAGAVDYISKPVSAVELHIALERALERRRMALELEEYRRTLENRVKAQTEALAQAHAAKEAAWEAALQALVDALDAREQETERHSLRVMRFTEMLARAYGVPESMLPDIARGALLHDIGKIGIPDAILLKPAGLTEAEWRVMRSHAEIGWQILSGIDYLAPAAEMVHAHQEQWDGCGYPRGLKGEQIPLGARLFAIVDAFDAIVSDRPYRKGRPVDWAREEIRRCGGTQFDPKGVEAFLRIPAEEWSRAKLELEREEREKGRIRLRRGDNLLANLPSVEQKLRPA